MPRPLLSVILAVAVAWAYSSGPPDGKTGRPGEGTCLDCHTGPAGSADSTELAGLPSGSYRPDSTYTLTLTVHFSGQSRWGFELTAVTAAGQRAGQLLILDSAGTQYSNTGPGYLKHTGTGTRPGTPGPTSWTLGWRAPAAGTGPVGFHWCCNAANNSGTTIGDAICRDSLKVNEGASVMERRHNSGRFLWRYTSPARNRVVVEYQGMADQPVRIYSAAGRLVRRLGPVRAGDALRAVWDGRDESGQPAPEAGYFMRLGREVSSVVRVEVVR